MNRNLKYKKISVDEIPTYEFYWFLSIIYAVVLVLRMYINWVFRLGYYFELGIILFIGTYLKNTADKYQILYKIYIIIFFVSYYSYLNYYVNFESSAIINYKWIN